MHASCTTRSTTNGWLNHEKKWRDTFIRSYPNFNCSCGFIQDFSTKFTKIHDLIWLSRISDPSLDRCQENSSKGGGKGVLAERVGLESEAKASRWHKVPAASRWGLKSTSQNFDEFSFLWRISRTRDRMHSARTSSSICFVVFTWQSSPPLGLQAYLPRHGFSWAN